MEDESLLECDHRGMRRGRKATDDHRIEPMQSDVTRRLYNPYPLVGGGGDPSTPDHIWVQVQPQIRV